MTGLVSLALVVVLLPPVAALTGARARAVATVVAFDLVGSTSQNLVSFTDDPAVPFTSAGDGFQKFQRGVSPTIPFSLLDDSLVIFPGDTLGIIKDGNTDEFFGVTDTDNNDTDGPVTATWVFNILGAAGLGLSIDMGAMGDFESPEDVFDFEYSIDGSPPVSAFAIAADESAAKTYLLEGGALIQLNDPLVADGTVLSNDLQRISTPLTGTGSELTLTLTADTNGGTEAFAFQNVVITDGGEITGPAFGTCGDLATPIHDIQGSGLASPLVNTIHVAEGVVVGDYQDVPTELGGFYLQEEDADQDANSATSEGIFVADHSFGVDVQPGEVVRVKGTVSESGTLTQIAGLTDVEVCNLQSGTASPAAVSLPLAAIDDFEATEGMAVSFPQRLYASGNFTWGRFGEVDLSLGGPLDNPTNVVAPGVPANSLQDLNNLSRIQLDDASLVQNPAPLPPYVGPGNTLRTGDTVDGLTAVMSFAGVYELHPRGMIDFARANVRPAPPDVGGSMTVAAYNVLNYFTTIDSGASRNTCGPLGNQGCRGADSQFELDRQRDKIVAALAGLDADVVGLIEIENPRLTAAVDEALDDLVNGPAGLNSVVGAGTYDYIDTGVIGGDAIKVALIYKPAVTTPAGPHTILDSSVNPLFDDTLNRPMLTQSFVENATGGTFTVGVNHLKSKGSNCNGVGDPDTGDGQGNCNLTRTNAAQAIVDYLATDPTGSGDSDYLVVGDLNAYAQEDPVATIEAEGYTDLIEAFVGSGYAAGAYSFNFFSQSGYLDHGLASETMTPQVTGAAFWHVNADEPSGLDYNSFNQPALYQPDQFRSSDHDPVVIGLNPNTALSQKEAARLELSLLLPTGNDQDDHFIEKAIDRIDQSLNPAWWTGPSTLDPRTGKHVFDREHQAVVELQKVNTVDVQAAIDALVDADRQLALKQLTSAILGGGDPGRIADAQANMADAAAHVTAGDFAKAVLDYKKAWTNAVKAL
jgi:predicted extracellular nuclease